MTGFAVLYMVDLVDVFTVQQQSVEGCDDEEMRLAHGDVAAGRGVAAFS